MNKLVFNAERHEYNLDGIIIPGYSQVVKDLGLVDYSKCNQTDLDYKQQVGTAVHKAIFLYNTGELDMESLAEPVTGYFDSWIMFMDMYKPKLLTEFSESPICSFKWRYGVTPDIVLENKTGLIVLELKCVSQIQPTTALQTSAQKLAIEETYNLKIKQRWALKLIPGCIPKMSVYESIADSGAWLSALNLWRWRKDNLK